MPSYQGDVFFRFRPIVICFVGIRLSRICGPSPTIRQSVAPCLERIKNWIAARTNLSLDRPLQGVVCLLHGRRQTVTDLPRGGKKPQASCESVFESCAVPLTKKLHRPNVTSRI
jgi:hypothetical protein